MTYSCQVPIKCLITTKWCVGYDLNRVILRLRVVISIHCSSSITYACVWELSAHLSFPFNQFLDQCMCERDRKSVSHSQNNKA